MKMSSRRLFIYTHSEWQILAKLDGVLFGAGSSFLDGSLSVNGNVKLFWLQTVIQQLSVYGRLVPWWLQCWSWPSKFQTNFFSAVRDSFFSQKGGLAKWLHLPIICIHLHLNWLILEFAVVSKWLQDTFRLVMCVLASLISAVKHVLSKGKCYAHCYSYTKFYFI